MEMNIETIAGHAAKVEGMAIGLAVIACALAEALPAPQQQEFLTKTVAGLENLEASMLAEPGWHSEFLLQGLRQIRAAFVGYPPKDERR